MCINAVLAAFYALVQSDIPIRQTKARLDLAKTFFFWNRLGLQPNLYDWVWVLRYVLGPRATMILILLRIEKWVLRCETYTKEMIRPAA